MLLDIHWPTLGLMGCFCLAAIIGFFLTVPYALKTAKKKGVEGIGPKK